MVIHKINFAIATSKYLIDSIRLFFFMDFCEKGCRLVNGYILLFAML
jgi:hypothetical protein